MISTKASSFLEFAHREIDILIGVLSGGFVFGWRFRRGFITPCGMGSRSASYLAALASSTTCTPAFSLMEALSRGLVISAGSTF